MHSACPYEDCVAQGMQLIATWLAWSHQAWRLQTLPLPAGQVNAWCAAFDRLPGSLPAPHLRALHRQLTQMASPGSGSALSGRGSAVAIANAVSRACRRIWI